MELQEKVAYLKGLAEGLGVDDVTKEGKIIKLIIDILDDVVLTLADTGEGFALLGEQLESMDEDLEEIMEDLYGDDEEDDEEDRCCGHGRHRGHHHHHDHDFEDDDDFEDAYEGELYEVTCPTCSDVICVDEDMLDEGQITCPGCGELLEFDLDGKLDESEIEDSKDEE